MAIFRKVHISFWSDAFISDLDAEKKLFYLYLLTNEKTSQCGVYELTKKQVSFDLGYSMDRVSILFRYFIDTGKILYNDSTKEVAIRNWLKFNESSSPKVRKCIEDGFKSVKDKELVNFVKNFDTVSIEYPYSMDTHSQEEEEEEKEEEEDIESLQIPDFPNFLNFSEPLVQPEKKIGGEKKSVEKTSAENFEKKEKKVAPKKEKKIRPDGEAPQPFMAMFVAMWQEFNWSKQNQANPAEAVSIEDFRKIFRPTPTDMSNLRKIIVSVRALCEAKKIVWTQEYARKSWKKFLEKAWEQDRWLREHWLLKNLNQNKDLILQNKTHDTGKSINGNNSPHGEKLGTSDARERAIKNFGLAKYLDGEQPPNH